MRCVRRERPGPSWVALFMPASDACILYWMSFTSAETRLQWKELRLRVCGYEGASHYLHGAYRPTFGMIRAVFWLPLQARQ